MLAATNDIIFKINDIILNPLIVLLFALALVFFLWGVFQYVVMQDSDAAHEQGRKHMFWGLIGMFIMFSVFAIMRLIAGTFGIDIPSGI
ncbi:MAG: hypothetical protein HYY92_00415 [Parcubacteria group bacterium]|nr:hypothetical protein [Parcubacteria group bacterium]